MAASRLLPALAFMAVAAAACGPRAQFSGQGPSLFPAAVPTETPRWICGRSDLTRDSGPYMLAGFPVPGYGIPDMGTSNWDMALHTNVLAAQVDAALPGVVVSVAGSGRAWAVYTPFLVRISGTLRGPVSDGAAELTVVGGTAGCYTTDSNTAPRLSAGREYILFVGSPALVGDAGEVLVAWPVDNDGMVQTPGGPMTIADLRIRIERLAAAASPTP